MFCTPQTLHPYPVTGVHTGGVSQHTQGCRDSLLLPSQGMGRPFMGRTVAIMLRTTPEIAHQIDLLAASGNTNRNEVLNRILRKELISRVHGTNDPHPPNTTQWTTHE